MDNFLRERVFFLPHGVRGLEGDKTIVLSPLLESFSPFWGQNCKIFGLLFGAFWAKNSNFIIDFSRHILKRYEPKN